MATEVPAKTETPPPTESKSARKKKAKAEAAAALAAAEPARSSSQAPSETPRGEANGSGGGYENPYIKDTQKQIRNVNKKLNGMQKLDQILTENPGVSLDDLVSSRKINADQKAQAQKKPALQQQLAQLEEQLSIYKKIDDDWRKELAKEKEKLQSEHAKDLEKLEEKGTADRKAFQIKDFRQRLLTLSRFLAAAARRRNLGDDIAETDESKAFENTLTQVYMATAEAVYAAEKLIDGSEDLVPSQEGGFINVSYGRVRDLSLEEVGSEDLFAVEDESAPLTDAAPPTDTIEPAWDPTVTNAGLTELDTTTSIPNGGADSLETPQAPASATIGEGAGNAAAEEQWDTTKPGADDPLAESYEMIPRDPAETETPHEQPVAAPAIQSWADDHPSDMQQSWTPVESAPAGAPQPTPSSAMTNGSDGFHEVHHGNRGRGPRGEGRGRSGYRSDGFRGRGRGGPRGEFRGRGRGGPRGGERGGYRGGRGGASES